MTWRLPDPSVWRPVKDTTPLGLSFSHRPFPSVAAKPQRRAEGWNPLGIQNRLRFALPQRGNVPQPKVAARPQPWVCAITHSTNPNGVVFRIASESIIKAKQRDRVVRAKMEAGK